LDRGARRHRREHDLLAGLPLRPHLRDHVRARIDRQEQDRRRHRPGAPGPERGLAVRSGRHVDPGLHAAESVRRRQRHAGDGASAGSVPRHCLWLLGALRPRCAARTRPVPARRRPAGRRRPRLRAPSRVRRLPARRPRRRREFLRLLREAGGRRVHGQRSLRGGSGPDREQGRARRRHRGAGGGTLVSLLHVRPAPGRTGRWRPIPGLTVRGTWSTAFRSPAVDDLYAGQTTAFRVFKDPCASIPGSNAALEAQCAAGPGGASAVNNGDTSNLIKTTGGGNPALQPETATTATVGAVIEPVKGLSVAADYYHVKLDDTITKSVGSTVILAGCYPASTGSGADPSPTDCSLITRDPATGRITVVADIAQNVGSLVTDGIDVSLRYDLPAAARRFRFPVRRHHPL